MNLRHRIPALSSPAEAGDGHARSRGQALVELALIVPVLLVILVGAGDLARVFAARITIESAARAGALEAALHPTSFVAGQPCDVTSNRVTCAVLTESHGGAIRVMASDVTLRCANYNDGFEYHHWDHACTEGLGHMVRVTVVGHVELLTPLLASFTGGQAFDTTATATAQISVRPSITGTTASPTPTPGPTAGFTPLPLPTPTPMPTPTPDPASTPGPTPTPAPTPSPTPYCAPPVANFTVSPMSGRKDTNGGNGTLFTFTDLSTTTPLCPLTWSWNFGDGAGAASVSHEESPKYRYSKVSGNGKDPGAFHVVLIASNAGGSYSHEELVTVTANGP